MFAEKDDMLRPYRWLHKEARPRVRTPEAVRALKDRAESLARRRRQLMRKISARILLNDRLHVVTDPAAFRETGVADLLDRSDVHEDISSSILRLDEAISLGRIEPVHRAAA